VQHIRKVLHTSRLVSGMVTVAQVGRHVKNGWDVATVEELISGNGRLKMRYLSFIITPCNSKYYYKIPSLLHNVFSLKNSYVLNNR